MERIALPARVTPIAYEISLYPFFDEEKFEGRILIRCTVIGTCSSLELHSRSIKVNRAVVRLKSNSWDVLDTLRYTEAPEILIIELPEEISRGDPNELLIELSYTGKFRDDSTGFYQASYETHDGVKHRFAATAMEPISAREVFPYFDVQEPFTKAEFVLCAVVDKSFVTVSNMPVRTTMALEHPSKKIVTFRKSVAMPIYHLCLVAGPLAEVKCTNSRIPMSVFCPLDTAAEFLGLALGGLHTKDQIEDVRAFFGGRDTEIAIDQNLENMENRRSWAERDISDVRSWLESHGYL